MGTESVQNSLSKQEIILGATIILGTIAALILLLPAPILLIGAVIIVLSGLLFVFAYKILQAEDDLSKRLKSFPIWALLTVPILIAIGLILYFNIRFSPLNGVVFSALLLLIIVYWTVTPMALFQHFREQTNDVEIDEWPEITALIPAYNEEGYVGRCIDSFLQAEYPENRLEISVVDDGSTDGTLAEARKRECERVTVLHKENGGKHSALNYGLDRSTNDLVVGVDADSQIESTALKRLIENYESHENACAIAGNIKISNRDSLLTRIQALEYIVSINMFRRALDLIGLVKVVPGCLGLFERRAIKTAGGFSGDTVTEDFDLTVELLKEGKEVHYSSRALARTEAPQTLTDLYNQRSRWLRGSFQTLLKHRDILIDPNFGLLHLVLAPYMLLSVAVVPFFGVVIFATIIWMIVFGPLIEFLGIFIIFVLLETLFETVALLIENDVESEDFYLARYSPLMVFGYKQLHDLVMLKSIFDVSSGADIEWTSVSRRRHSEEKGD